MKSFFTVCGRPLFPEEGDILFAHPKTLLATCPECRKTPWAPKTLDGNGRRSITDPKILERIRYEYEELELSCAVVGRLHGVQKTTIKNYLEEMGVKIRPKGGVFGANMVPAREIERIRFLYWDCRLSTSEVAEVLGIAPGTVLSRMKNHGIPRRNKQDASRLPWERGIRKDAHKAKNFPTTPLSKPTLIAA